MLFSQLLLAHLLGDFLLQPRRALVHKQTHRAGSWFLYVHALIHFVLTLLLVWDLHFWKLAGIIAITHLLIDLAKLYARSWFANDRIPFILDQLAHLAVLFAVATYPETAATVTDALANADWALLAGLFFVTFPAAIINAKLLEGLSNQIQLDHTSLPGAGMIIGILERLLVFLFILLDRWEAIGLLIAAKSVFRFNDLKESNNRKWTEYILIGTLLSFGMAMAAGLAVGV